MYTFGRALGLPIADAREYFRKHGYNIRLIEYKSKRILGNDVRVIRERIIGDEVELVVGFFKTGFTDIGE